MGTSQRQQKLIASATIAKLRLAEIYQELYKIEGAIVPAIELKVLVDKIEAWQNKHTTKKVRK